MILFTIGTSEPFDRLVRVADAVAERFNERVLVQGGRSACRLRTAELVDFLSFDELVEATVEARSVVTHAGVGSILLARREGRTPIVVPRLRRFGEAVDDHQLEFGRRLDALGLVRLIEEPNFLPAAIAAQPLEVANRRTVVPELAVELRQHLERSLGPVPEAAV